MFKLLKELSWFIKKNVFWYLAVFLAGVSVTFLALLIPTFLTQFVSYIENKTLTNDLLMLLVIKMILVSIGIYLSIICKRGLQSYLTTKLNFKLREKFLREILYQDKLFFEKYNSGDLIARATGDIMWVRHAAINSFNDILTDFVSIALTMGFCLSISLNLTLLSIIPLPLVYIISNVLRPKIRSNWKKVREEVSNMNDAIMEDVGNVKLIRSFVKEEQSNKKLKNTAQRVYEIEKKNLKINSLFNPLFQSISTISLLIALFVGGKKVIEGTLDVDKLFGFTIYLGMLVWPLLDIGLSLNSFHQSLVSLDRLNEIFFAPIYVRNKLNAKILKFINTIEFKNLSFKYSKEANTYAIKNIDLLIKKGETIGIVGKTGSGKSTLVNQLLRNYPIFEGEILIDGQNIEDFTKESVRSQISMVPQEHILFTRTVKENILIGAQNDFSEERIKEVLMDADFEKDIINLSHGLDTVVGEYGVTLSGGQKQRLSIARAFMKNSNILILDDSLSAVDGQTEANIIKSIIAKRKNQTNIIISHRLTAVQHADEIIVLDKGLIIEKGSHIELMQSKKWYYTQYMEQLMKVKK